MFFEASRFGCRKTNFDATKVTYNKYSCVISSMSIEMMKMDGRDSTEYQNWEKNDIMVIIEIVVNENNVKNCTALSSPIKMTKKRAEQRGWTESSRFSIFVLEREPLLFGTRRKAALRGASYAWTPDLRSFDKLLEVGVSPYLGSIPSLSTLLMFELNEVVRGRLIAPKTWDRIVGNFFRIVLLSVTVQKFSGCLCEFMH